MLFSELPYSTNSCIVLVYMCVFVSTVFLYFCVCLQVCVYVCLCVEAIISVVGVGIFGAKFYGNSNTSPFGWSFALTIVGIIFLLINGILLIPHTIMIHMYVCNKRSQASGRSRTQRTGFFGTISACFDVLWNIKRQTFCTGQRADMWTGFVWLVWDGHLWLQCHCTAPARVDVCAVPLQCHCTAPARVDVCAVPFNELSNFLDGVQHIFMTVMMRKIIWTK